MTSVTAERPTFQHVILTRFNVKFGANVSVPSIGTDEAWLAHRFDLFEKYCVPTVAAQNNMNFAWLLFMDAETPDRYLDRIMNLTRIVPAIRPVYCTSFSLDFAISSVAELLEIETSWVITTRLDNDDGIQADFVDRVQRAQSFECAEVFNFPLGAIITDAKGYLHTDRSNAFISLSEPRSQLSTVMSIYNHNRAAESFPVTQIPTAQPMWLQVVHESNVSNRVRGRRVQLGAIDFATALGGRDRKPEKRSEILVENLIFYPLRSMRDSAISRLRHILRRFGIELRRPRKGRPIPARARPIKG